MIKVLWACCLLVCGIFIACKPPINDLKTGTWRAILETNSGAEIPFIFQVSQSEGKKAIHIINGAENIKVEGLMSGRNVTIPLPSFGSEIKAKLTSSGLEGAWIRHLPNKDSEIPFRAEYNIKKRFVDSEAPMYNITGRWRTRFVAEGRADSTIAVGEFIQKGALVKGTFLTASGDYRYLEGSVSGDKLSLSAFDGAHAYLFTATIKGPQTISEGKFYAGASAVEDWSASKNAQASLPDAYSLTSLKEGTSSIEFNFESLDGKPVSLKDDVFENKIIVVQLFGSWCPNCVDEMKYLVQFYNKYHKKGVEVVGLAYERSGEKEWAKKAVGKLKQRLNVPYPLLLTGYTHKEVVKSMPQIVDFKSFPTTIVIDKNKKARKIHTGFTGPATGAHYANFIKEFEAQIDMLLAEK